MAKLTEKIAASIRGLPIPSAQGGLAAYLTYWLENVAVHQLRTACQCCVRGVDTARDEPRCCAASQCCGKLLSPLTLAYIHSVLKSALEHAVREEEIPRNVARNVRTGTPRPRRFEPRTADEACQFLTAVARSPAARPARTRPPHRTPQGRTPRPALGRPRP